MFAIKRNQVIITALVLMIAVAGYLNYVDKNSLTPSQVVLTDEGEVSALVPEGSVGALEGFTQALGLGEEEALTEEGLSEELLTGELTDEITVDDNPEILTEVSAISEEEQTEPGAAVFVNQTDDTSYFIQAKLSREQARAKQKDLLLELINNEGLEQAKKSEAADAMLSIQEKIEKETATESMIEAKGFKEVYVRIDDATVDVVVSKESLTEAETAQIEDIVKRKTGMTAEQIRISTMKK